MATSDTSIVILKAIQKRTARITKWPSEFPGVHAKFGAPYSANVPFSKYPYWLATERGIHNSVAISSSVLFRFPWRVIGLFYGFLYIFFSKTGNWFISFSDKKVQFFFPFFVSYWDWLTGFLGATSVYFNLNAMVFVEVFGRAVSILISDFKGIFRVAFLVLWDMREVKNFGVKNLK